MSYMKSNKLDRLSFVSLFTTILLIPFFFLSFVKIPLDISKSLVLILGITLSFVFWVLARFFDAKIVIAKSPLFLGLSGVLLVTFLSAVFSKTLSLSFFGIMLDIGSFYSILAFVVLTFLSSIIFKDLKKARILLFGIVFSAFVVFLFQIVHFIFIDKNIFGIFIDQTSNLLGSWKTFGIFSGLTSIISVLFVEFYPINRNTKIFLYFILALSLVFNAIVNFSLVWELLGIFSLFIFIYHVLVNFKEEKKEHKDMVFPFTSFIVSIISLVFFIIPMNTGLFNEHFKIVDREVLPSFNSTIIVTKAVLSKNPVLGIGPNKFEEAWAMHKPNINMTRFWDVSFNFGSSLITTFLATTGYLGILSYCVLFVMFLYFGFKILSRGLRSNINWETLAFYLLSLYLFICISLYTTSFTIIILAFVSLGVFIGLYNSLEIKKEIVISFLGDYRKRMLTMFVLAFLVISSVALCFKNIERFVAVFYFEKTLSISNTNIPDAEKYINKTVRFYVNDLYLRLYSQIYLYKLETLAQKGENTSGNKVLMQDSLDRSVDSAKLATAYNPNNYLNFDTLGAVYQRAGFLGVPDSYNQSLNTSKIASSLNPTNPRLKLALANISNSLGEKQDAKVYIKEALDLKDDYVDAFILASQIAKSEGDNSSALSYAQKALEIYPNNENLLKYVASFKNPVTEPIKKDNKKK